MKKDRLGKLGNIVEKNSSNVYSENRFESNQIDS